MGSDRLTVDVLCVGTTSFDLILSVPCHPQPDEKSFATSLLECGGGPAANAAVTVARLGYRAAFAGYLGDDLRGDQHLHELQREGVMTELVIRGTEPTPVSVILVKPDGTRTVVAYRGETPHLQAGCVDLGRADPKVILFDGHEPHISLPLIQQARRQAIPTVLDAGSVHSGTRALAPLVQYLVCSERFALDFTGETSEGRALERLSNDVPFVVISLGERGLVWRAPDRSGRLPAFPIDAVDTTGAGDAFHGGFAVCVSEGMEWEYTLRYASATAALCCMHLGARTGIPTADDVAELLRRYSCDG
ncbi:carbohydrate kinase family protein [Planctomycetota bacterium]